MDRKSTLEASKSTSRPLAASTWEFVRWKFSENRFEARPARLFASRDASRAHRRQPHNSSREGAKNFRDFGEKNSFELAKSWKLLRKEEIWENFETFLGEKLWKVRSDEGKWKILIDFEASEGKFWEEKNFKKLFQKLRENFLNLWEKFLEKLKIIFRIFFPWKFLSDRENIFNRRSVKETSFGASKRLKIDEKLRKRKFSFYISYH